MLVNGFVHRSTAILYFRHLQKIICYELKQKSDALFSGEIEIDESYFGDVRKEKRGAKSKTPVFHLLKRGGKVYAKIIPDFNTSLKTKLHLIVL